jgi:large subunit ribosomal protein L19
MGYDWQSLLMNKFAAMNEKVMQFNATQQNKKVPKLSVGDIVRVHKRIVEGNKERVQVFKGLVIAIKGKQSSSPTITVRRESGGVGVEATFPIHLPSIERIDLLRHSKVRRSKLYYMRERTGKAAKMKVKDLSEDEEKMINEMKAKLKQQKQEKEVKKDKNEKPADKKEQQPEKAQKKEEKKEEKKPEEKKN